MTTHTLNGKKLLVVDVPEGTKNYHVWNNDRPSLGYEYVIKNSFERAFGDESKFITLPPGNYSLVLTEEDAKGVVEKVIKPNEPMYYKIYHSERDEEGYKEVATTNALKSLHSWIRSKGKDPKRVVVLIKND